MDTSCFTGAGAKRIALPIVAVKVREPGGCKSIETYALLDSGSTASFCSDKLFNKLGVKGHRERISVTTLGQAGRAEDTRVTSLEVSDIYETNVVSLPAVYGKETLPIHKENIATCSDVTSWSHLNGIDIPQVDTDEVMLLIGQDVPDALIQETVVSGKKGEPYAAKTILGWSLNGPMQPKQGSRRITSHFLTTQSMDNERLEEQVEQF